VSSSSEDGTGFVRVQKVINILQAVPVQGDAGQDLAISYGFLLWMAAEKVSGSSALLGCN